MYIVAKNVLNIFIINQNNVKNNVKNNGFLFSAILKFETRNFRDTDTEIRMGAVHKR